MAKFTLPQPGTEISVKWNEFGPMITVRGSSADLAVTLELINGQLERKCGFPAAALKTATEVGAELFGMIVNGSIVVDLAELARQAKEESHEDP